jgi:hypothetical protein
VNVSSVRRASTKGGPLTSHELDDVLSILRGAIRVETEANGYSSPVATALRASVPSMIDAAGLVAGREAARA